MEEYPECPICYDIYGINQSHIKAPKILKCGDSLCKECLEKIIKKSTDNFILCPICQKKDKKEGNIENYITNKEIIRLVNASFNIPNEQVEHNQDNKKQISFKIIRLGSSGVGKTCILNRLKYETYKEDFSTTIMIEIMSPYYVKYKKQKYKLFFYDTCGQEKMFNAILREDSIPLPSNYLKQSDGALFVFDLSAKDTFDDLEKWYNKYKNEKENVVGVLIGNKCDEIRQVNYEEAKKFADEHGLEYFETSAKLDKKLKKAIASLLEKIIDSKAHWNSLDKERFQLNPRKTNEGFLEKTCKLLSKCIII